MNRMDAVITRIIDIRPYRQYWMVEVEADVYGSLTVTKRFTDTEEQARSIKPGDVIGV